LIVQFSDFTNPDGSFYGCSNSNKVVVFAKNKVFIDKSISPLKSAGVDYELAIVSPQWEVTNDFSIDLSGLSGADGGP